MKQGPPGTKIVKNCVHCAMLVYVDAALEFFFLHGSESWLLVETSSFLPETKNNFVYSI